MKFPLLLSVVVLLMSASSAVADTFETRRCINMGNALDAPTEGEWGHTIEAASFQRIAAAGFDTVRIPVRWSAHTGNAPDFTIDPEFFARVTDVIQQALANDLQVILNIHHFDALNAAPEDNREKFLALWSQIAERYKALPESVYFEVINEPNDNFEGDVMRSIVTAGFQKIRETNPTRILIMGGDNWSSIRSLSTIPTIDDPNQVHTFHYYDPFKFTHQKASWTQLKNSGIVNWGSKVDREELQSAADYAKQVQDERGIPVFLGEIGAYEQAPYDDVVAYTRQTREAFEAAGISWCVWSFTATFPFFDSGTQQWDINKLAALGLSADGSSAPGPTAKARDDAAGPEDFAGQTLEDAFNHLRRYVGHDGELMMSPFPDQLTHYGAIKVKQRKDTSVPGAAAMQAKVTRVGANPWDAGLSGPLAVSIKQGDTLVMAYWARVTKGEGVITNAGLQMNAEPYTPLGPLQPATLSAEWQRFTVTAVADRDYAASEVGYTMQLAGAKQTLQFGPVFVMNLGQGIGELALGSAR
ncbi:MAG: glycoside hydrolase family 5 protein [Pseudomonadota bacterium]